MVVRVAMLGWVVTFLILSVIAAYLGFFGLAGLAAVIVRFLLLVFLLLLLQRQFEVPLGAPIVRPEA